MGEVMKKMLVRFLALSVLLGFAVSAPAADYTWRGVNTADLYTLLGPLRTDPDNPPATLPHDLNLFVNAATG